MSDDSSFLTAGTLLETPGYLTDPAYVAGLIEQLAEDGFVPCHRPSKAHATAWYEGLFGMWCWLRERDETRLREAWRMCGARGLFLAALDAVVATPFCAVGRSTLECRVMALPVSIRLSRGNALGMPRLDRTAVQALSALFRSHFFGGRFARVHATIHQADAVRLLDPSEHLRYVQDLVDGRLRSAPARAVRIGAGNTVAGAVFFWGLAESYTPAASPDAVADAAGAVLAAWGRRQSAQYRLTCVCPSAYVDFCRVQAALSHVPATPCRAEHVEAAVRAF